MRLKDWDQFKWDFTQEMLNVMAVKNPDYTAGEDDAMAHYKVSAAETGVEPIQAWHVLLTKHLMAIRKFARSGSVCSEAIRGRLVDAANYMILGAALIEDLEDSLTQAVEEITQPEVSDERIQDFLADSGSITRLAARLRTELSERQMLHLIDDLTMPAPADDPVPPEEEMIEDHAELMNGDEAESEEMLAGVERPIRQINPNPPKSIALAADSYQYRLLQALGAEPIDGDDEGACRTCRGLRVRGGAACSECDGTGLDESVRPTGPVRKETGR